MYTSIKETTFTTYQAWSKQKDSVDRINISTKHLQEIQEILQKNQSIITPTCQLANVFHTSFLPIFIE
jgi:hypothetical protein